MLRSFYNVYNKLGYGFLEKVYENSMIIECKKTDLRGVQQASIKVYYKTATNVYKKLIGGGLRVKKVITNES